MAYKYMTHKSTSCINGWSWLCTYVQHIGNYISAPLIYTNKYISRKTIMKSTAYLKYFRIIYQGI